MKFNSDLNNTSHSATVIQQENIPQLHIIMW